MMDRVGVAGALGLARGAAGVEDPAHFLGIGRRRRELRRVTVGQHAVTERDAAVETELPHQTFDDGRGFEATEAQPRDEHRRLRLTQDEPQLRSR